MYCTSHKQMSKHEHRGNIEPTRLIEKHRSEPNEPIEVEHYVNAEI